MADFVEKLKRIREEIANTRAILKLEQEKEAELLEEMKEVTGIDTPENAEKRLKEITQELIDNDNAMKRLVNSIEEILYGESDQ